MKAEEEEMGGTSNTYPLLRETLGPKSDPMNSGVDWKQLTLLSEEIEEKKKKLELPGYYDVHRSVQLLPGRVIDTTNRSMVLEAQQDGFDPDGFQKGQGLKKDLFYMNPFISCQWCNRLNFVDVISVRRSIHLPADTGGLPPPEEMPPCLGCGRADGFEIGSTDYIQLIEDREREMMKRRKLEVLNAMKIQAFYRAHLRHRYGYAFHKKILGERRLVYRAATMIQSHARVRLARRRIRTERNLVIIKSAHLLLLRWALRPGPDRVNTFWYPNKSEERLVYSDYIDFCTRTGFIPPRKTVEKNIAELATRIRNRQHTLITLVQRRYRGVMARRVLVLYKMETYRYRQWQFANIIKLQSLWRGYILRLQLPVMIRQLKSDQVMQAYRKHREEEKFYKGRAWVREVARKAYRTERQEEKTVRMTSRIREAKEYNGRKMKAFADSVYADDRLANAIDDLIHRETADMAAIKAKEDEVIARKQFMVSRVNEHGPSGFGYRGFSYSQKGENAPPMYNRVTAFLVSAVQAEKNESTETELHQDSFIRHRQSAEESLTGGGGLSLQKMKEREAKEVARKKRSKEEAKLFKATSPSRGRAMQALFKDELDEILSKEVKEATQNSFKKNVLGKLRSHNTERGYKSAYKYPKDINVDPLKWLNDDIDTTIKFQDQNIRNRINNS